MGLLDSEISKDIRNRLLKRNIVSSTVERNGLSSLLYSVGKPAVIGAIPPNIVDSDDLEDIGSTVRDFMLVNNKYIATPIEYERISINTISSNITTQYPNYLERVTNLVGGGASSNASNVINNVLGGLVPRYSIGGGNPLFDVTSILSGGRSNPSNETPLGIIGANQLGFAIQVNSAFNLYEETIGTVNTNPISLLMGNPIIFPNYKITVAKGTGGVILDFAERILGFNTPVSLLATSSSIFYSESGDITNVERANNMLSNTGKGQVSALLWLMNQNKYKATYVDPRDPNGGVRGDLYAFQYGQGDTNGGYIIDMLNGGENNPVSKSNYDLENMVRDSGFKGINDLPQGTSFAIDVDGTELTVRTDFIWDLSEQQPLTTFGFSEKSILSKTKALFDSNRVKASPLSPYIKQNGTEINSAIYNAQGTSYMSKGSGSIKFNGITPESDPQKMFFRTFSKVKQYDRVKRLQKHSGVNLDAGVSLKKDGTFSVLDDNGFVKVSPPNKTDNGLEVKKYMLSIENLAWYGYTNNIIPEEVGNGDPISGKKGRIMWFPPYDLSFTDNTSVNWEKTDFIGRGEPIYTYNNTTRTGSLQFKIIIDHPSYLNSLKGESDDLINSLFTGGFEVDKRVRNRLSADELALTDLAFNTAVDKTNNTPDPLPENFELFYPYNDQLLSDIIDNDYEDGSGFDQAINPTGLGEGIGAYGDIDGVTRVDNTNYGLNSSQWLSPDNSEAQGAIFRDCTGCKVRLTTYGVTGENPNARRDRVFEVEEYIKNEWANPADKLINKRFKIIDGGVVSVQVVDFNGFPLAQFGKDIKSKIKVTVEFEFDAKLKEEANPNTKAKIPDPLGDTNASRRLTEGIKKRFYSEEGYFQKLEQEDKFVYDSISQKISFFHPAFHSITPEGFNSRLTFLQQCTRQGPTVFQSGGGLDLNKESSGKLSPDNMAFGQPPVCILRLGDFYYSKIIIDSVNFGFDPLVWDLNPEGIGVQPMICTVDLNFAFIGGSSLQGPISKLQNAVTYNFFANTQIYEPASNYMGLKGINAETGEYQEIKDTENSVGGGDYYPGSNIRSIVNPATALNVTSIPLPAVDQEAELQLVQAQNAPTPTPTTGTTADLARISVSSIEIEDGTNIEINKSGIFVNITFTFEGVNADDSSTHLGDAYQLGEVILTPRNGNNQIGVILYQDELSLDGDAPTQIIRGQVFISDDKLKPVTDNTSNILTKSELNKLIQDEDLIDVSNLGASDINLFPQRKIDVNGNLDITKNINYQIFRGNSNVCNNFGFTFDQNNRLRTYFNLSAYGLARDNAGNPSPSSFKAKVNRGGSRCNVYLITETQGNATQNNPTYIDLTEAEVTILLGELVKMEKGLGETKTLTSKVTLNKSDKYGLPLEA